MARRGAAPPRSNRTFIPPPLNSGPKLPVQASISFDAPVLLASDIMGDPLSRVDASSLGLRRGSGIGDAGCCGGIGPGHGPTELDVRAISGEMIPPKLIYKIEPEFSEEARKAKYQGTVILAIEVDESGHTRNLRVISGPGLGLEQKAIEAVARWLFHPARWHGKPVISTARVEVSFHLL